MNNESARMRERLRLDDDELQELIEEHLGDDPVFHVGGTRRASLEVDVDDGVATLRGVVRRALDRRKADIVARALGATTVDNRLRVEEDDAQRKPRRGNAASSSLPRIR
jgi:osmotically-inducible protein OsmY